MTDILEHTDPAAHVDGYSHLCLACYLIGHGGEDWNECND